MKKTAELASFWRRIFAFLIDFIIIWTVSMAISFIFRDTFILMGENLWYFGFLIFGLYCTIENGSIGKGRTLGKKILKIQVMECSGKFLKIHQAFLRYFVLSLAIFYSGMSASAYSISGNFAAVTLFNILAVFVLLGTLGILAFNKNRRGLHDYITNSIVVATPTSSKSGSEEEVIVPQVNTFCQAIAAHKTYFISIISLFLLISMVIVFSPIMLNVDADFEEMKSLKNNIKQSFDLYDVSVQTEWTKQGSAAGTKNLIISGYLRYSDYYNENTKTELYQKISKKIDSSYTWLESYDNVIIEFRTGYDIGMAGFSIYENKVFPIIKEWA